MKNYSAWLGFFARIVLGGVLITAGWLKAFNVSDAENAVRAYKVLPLKLADLVGITLPWVEIGLGLLLILGVATRISAILAGAIMILFIIAISQAALRGLSIDCGCFGGGGQVAQGETKYLEEILRDTGLTLLALYLVKFPRGRFALDR